MSAKRNPIPANYNPDEKNYSLTFEAMILDEEIKRKMEESFMLGDVSLTNKLARYSQNAQKRYNRRFVNWQYSNERIHKMPNKNKYLMSRASKEHMLFRISSIENSLSFEFDALLIVPNSNSKYPFRLQNRDNTVHIGLGDEELTYLLSEFVRYFGNNEF